MIAVYAVLFCIFLADNVSAEVENIDNQKLTLLMVEGIPIVDIREEFEWKETGILPKSHLITFFDSNGKYNIGNWLMAVRSVVSQDDKLIIICRSGRRSRILAEYLSNTKNFQLLYNVEAGIKGWKNSNLETEAFQPLN